MVTSEAVDGTRSCLCYCCVTVSVETNDLCYGATSATSMSGEIMAQSMGAMLMMHLADGEMDPRLIDVVFDHATASRAARANSATNGHPLLSAVAAVLSHIFSMRRPIAWFHTYSRCGEVLNELVDNIVVHGAKCEDARQGKALVVAEWCREYTPEKIRLLCLLMLPLHLVDQYPVVSGDGTSIRSTPAATVKWGLPAHEIARNIDQAPTSDGPRNDWLWAALWGSLLQPGHGTGGGCSHAVVPPVYE